ncbi:soma ferritin [Teleopsis dalmanni]|uniref:soma ferritin n=1 Tax=Teleopsis dalmanni TaxID=139649 RepID=UPI0018CE995C|nr:soma ferritin [Teleopsis dalmanni]
MNFAGRITLSRLMCLMVRQNFPCACEKGINDQIKKELQASYDYMAIAYYFNRSDIALPGMFKFFKHASDEERQHAELFMDYQNKRGGTIELQDIEAPNKKVTSIKEAMVEALRMEKEVNQSLLDLHATATNENDPNLCDFLEANFLSEQVEAQKQLADYITQIERCNEELGDFIFDKKLAKSGSVHKE